MQDEREARLPGWAQSIIGNLRTELKQVRESAAKEIAVLRPRTELLERRVGALEEIITSAYRGGYTDFAEVANVFRSYGLVLVKEDK